MEPAPTDVDAQRDRSSLAGATSVLRSTGVRLLTPVYARAGSAYLAGAQRSQAVGLAARLLADGRDVTLGYWPLKTSSAAELAAENLGAIDAMSGHGGRVSLAVKAPALGFDRDIVLRMARRAADAQVRLVFDAHTPADAAPTLALAREARAEGTPTGIALPGRWARTLADVASVAEAGLDVRLIKGQWPDDAPGAPAGESGLRTSYLRALDRLLEHRVPVSVATHDGALLQRALARMVAAGAPADVELLLGLPVRRPLALAVGSTARLGFYVPYGHPGLPYPFLAVLRRLRLTAMLAQGIALGVRNQRIQQNAVFGRPRTPVR